MDLRPYQVEAIDGARQRVLEGAKRILLICPTGGGKTVIAAEIIRSALEKRSRTLFLAHRRELILQTCDKLHRFGVRHGVIMAGMPRALHQPVQVASVQTLIRNRGSLSQIDLIFVDEAHHVTTANTYADLLESYPQARVVGLTATPWRLDGHGLGDVFDAHVVARTPRELRDDGFLVPVGGWQYKSIDTSDVSVRRGDFVVDELAAAANKSEIVGDIVGEWQAHATGRRTLLFAINIEHSMKMTAAFRAAGVPAEHIDGTTPTRERDAALARLRSGETLVICNCNVLTEGFDCPELEVCILARPTLSTSLYLQMVGRVLRPSPGKAGARIHDHAGCLAAHGHPFADRDYSPGKAAPRNTKKLLQCKQCKSVVSGWPCDVCRWSPPVEAAGVGIGGRVVRHVAAAAVREIGNDPTDQKASEFTKVERASNWRAKFAHNEERKLAFFSRMVVKHGILKGARVYRWFSGETECPPADWVRAATDLETGENAIE